MTKNAATCLSLVLLSVASFAQLVSLEGQLLNYRNKPVSVLAYEDFLTFTTSVISEVTTDDKGYFKTQFNLDHATSVALKIDQHTRDLFVTPGNHYTIKFGDDLIITSVESQDNTNNLLAFVDEAYKRFKAENNRGDKKLFSANLDKLTSSLELRYGNMGSNFFKEILKYKIGLFRFNDILHSGDSARFIAIENSLLIEVPVLWHNKEYFRFLTSLYFWKANLTAVRPTRLRGYEGNVATYSMIKNDTVRQLAMLDLHREAYTKIWRTEMNIDRIIDSIARHSVDDHIKIIGENVKKKYSTTKEKEFVLLLPDSTTKKISDYSGKFVLLDFWYVGCSACMKSMPKIIELRKKLGDRLKVLSINPVDDLSKMRKFLSTRKEYDWVFLYSREDDEMDIYYNVDGFPTYYLLNPAGKAVLKRFNLEENYDKIVSLVNKEQ